MQKIATTRNGKTTPFGRHGALRVEGAHILDSNGKICQLKGLSSHNISNYPEYINYATLEEMTDRFNLDIFRFAMYSATADGFAGYADGDDTHREQLEKLLMETVEITAKLGIYLLIDWHILFDYDPNMHTDMAIAFFQKMVPQLISYDHILYEICNEPNQDCTWEQVTNYANQVIPVIHNTDTSKIVIVGTPIWSQRVDEPAKNPLKFPNLMYAFHFYADTHREELRELVADAFDNYKVPIFVTEFGVCDASGNGPINLEQTNAWIDLLNDRKISYILWNLSNKNETSAILVPDCTKITGFTDEDFSDSGKYLDYMTKNS